MSFEINDETDLAGIWFVDAGPTNGFDWLAQVFKQDGGKWEASYRFRYHAEQDPNDPKDPFEDNDEKSWYRLSAPNGGDDARAKLVTMMQEIARKLCAAADGRLDETLDIGKGYDNFIAMAKDKPYMHIKSEAASKLGGSKKVVEA